MSDCFIYGIHAVQAILNNPKRKIRELWLQEDNAEHRLSSFMKQAEARQIPVHRVSSQTLKKKFGDRSHQGVVLNIYPSTAYTEKDLFSLFQIEDNPLILILDGITDPHNLGACLRSADATNVNVVIIPKDKSANTQNPIVSKVACGAVESIPCIAVTNLSRTIQQLQEAGVWIFGAAAEASKSLWSIDFKGPVAIVMGSEGGGLRRLTRENCDELFFLPMLGTVESLNVSVATGICLYEVQRQRS